MKLSVQIGATSQIWQIFVRDSSSTTGGGLTGLVFNSASLTAYYHRDTDTTATAITLVTMTVGTFTSSGFKEIDATNMPGWYQFCPPNAALASGAKNCGFHLKGATNMAPLPMEVQLVSYNPDDAVRLGLTALPNAAAAAANGLPVLGTNASAISFTAGFTISSTTGDAFTITSSGGNGIGMNISGNGSGDGFRATAGATGRGMHALGGATSGAGFRAEGQGSNSSGFHGLGFGTQSGFRFEGGATGPGAMIIGGGTSGDGIDITTTVGDGLSILPTAGNAIVATANGTSKHGAVITGGTAGTSDGLKAVAGTGGVPIRGDITGNVTGNLSGSVGSVTGAVGSVTGAVGSVAGNVGGNVVGSTASVTGNVGGNVVGTVASVVGAVGSVTGNVGGNVVGSVGSVTGAVGSVTTPVSIAAGQLFVKKNTAITITFPMTDSVTHAPATGLTVSASRSIDGAAVGSCANSVTELSLGLYRLVLATTDTNGAEITYIFSATGADTKFLLVVTQA